MIREVTLDEAQSVWIEFVTTHRDWFQFHPKLTYKASMFLIGSHTPPTIDGVRFFP